MSCFAYDSLTCAYTLENGERIRKNILDKHGQAGYTTHSD